MADDAARAVGGSGSGAGVGGAGADGVAAGAVVAGETAELRSRNPLARVPEDRRMRLLLWAVVAVVVTGAFMAAVSTDLEVEGRATIIEFELARDVDAAQLILDNWGTEGRQAALASLWSDYPFLISYAVALGMASLLIAERARARGWNAVCRLGLVLAWGALAAGLLDAIENAFLISEMASGPTVRQVAGARTAATVKFALVLVGLSYVVCAGLAVRLAPGRPSD